jgi:hypothetical protein
MLFTSANARAMAARAVQARADRKALAGHVPEQAKISWNAPTDTGTDHYRVKRLLRTRRQIDMLDKQLESTTDYKALKSIADAIARLSEIERLLAGRPLPGSNRPRSEKPRRSSLTPEPTETPQPVVSCVPQEQPPVQLTTPPVQPPLSQ